MSAESNATYGAMLCPKGTEIATHTRKFVDVLHPDPETICIEDIAHHLSTTNRYGGACDRPYSVAEHCLLTYRLGRELVHNPASSREFMLALLLHDASEAYLQDVVSPVKFAMRIEEMETIVGTLSQPYEEHAVLKNWRGTYGKLCDRMDRAICAALNLRPQIFEDDRVHLCDMWALRIESRILLPDRGETWRWPEELPNNGEAPWEDVELGCNWAEVRSMYLSMVQKEMR